jgi:hypothetical protein
VTEPRSTHAAWRRSPGYVFDGTAGTVFVLLVDTSLAGEGRTRGLTLRLVQPVALHRLTGTDAQDDTVSGVLIAQGGTGQIVEGANGNGLRVWVAAAADQPCRHTNDLAPLPDHR